jgi:hypothetical protein
MELTDKFIHYPTGEDFTDKVQMIGTTLCDANGIPFNMDGMWLIGLGVRDNPQIVPTGIILVIGVVATADSIFWIPRTVQKSTGLLDYMEGEYQGRTYFAVQNSLYMGSAMKTLVLKPIV